MKTTQGDSKKRGAGAAKEWLRTASSEVIISLAAAELEYGETLSDLISEGIEVPDSTDRDFSWGFYKQVKGHVNAKVFGN